MLGTFRAREGRRKGHPALPTHNRPERRTQTGRRVSHVDIQVIQCQMCVQEEPKSRVLGNKIKKKGCPALAVRQTWTLIHSILGPRDGNVRGQSGKRRRKKGCDLRRKRGASGFAFDQRVRIGETGGVCDQRMVRKKGLWKERRALATVRWRDDKILRTSSDDKAEKVRKIDYSWLTNRLP